MNTFVMVIDRHREGGFGLLLPNDVVIQVGINLLWGWQGEIAALGDFGELFFNNLVTAIKPLMAILNASSTMRLRTCFWVFPQKEHFSRSADSPIRAISSPYEPYYFSINGSVAIPGNIASRAWI